MLTIFVKCSSYCKSPKPVQFHKYYYRNFNNFPLWQLKDVKSHKEDIRPTSQTSPTLTDNPFVKSPPKLKKIKFLWFFTMLSKNCKTYHESAFPAFIIFSRHLNQIQVNVLLMYSLKTSENWRFSEYFQRVKKRNTDLKWFKVECK